MTQALIVVLLIVVIAICYGAGRLHQWLILIDRERQRKSRLPNWMIAGLEDAQAIDIDVLLWIRDALKIVEGRLDDRMRVIGEIRSGDYDKEKPAKSDGR